GIEGVVVARAALHPEEDAAHRLGIAFPFGRGGVPEAQEGGEAQAESGQAADAKKRSARHTCTVGGVTREEIEHGASLRRSEGGTKGWEEGFPSFSQTNAICSEVNRNSSRGPESAGGECPHLISLKNVPLCRPEVCPVLPSSLRSRILFTALALLVSGCGLS